MGLVARGLGLAIVARTASVRRPSVAVIVTALRAAAKALPGQGVRPGPAYAGPGGP